jgi:RNA polymerase primary sigma factor
MKKLDLTGQKIVITKDTRSINSYLNELNSIKKTDKPECDKTPDELVKDNLSFVIAVARKFQHNGISIEDLINEGNLGMIMASKKYRPDMGAKFISYAVWYIKAWILTLLNDSGKKIKLPANKMTDFLKIKEIKKYLEQKLEREPTLEEIAELLPNYDKHLMLDVIDSQKVISSIDDITYDELKLEDILSNDVHTSKLNKEQMDDLISNLYRFINKNPNKSEKDCLLSFFGLHPQFKTINEAANYYNISINVARNRKNRAINKVKSRIRREKFKFF